MRRIREVLRLRALLGENLSAISAGAGLARSTVRGYLQRADRAGLGGAGATEHLSDEALEAALFPAPTAVVGAKRPLPDWGQVDGELRRHKHVTRRLLWLEYRAEHPDGYEFSQFKRLLAEWQKASGRSLSMHQVHRAGVTVQVDYAGDTVTIHDAGVERVAQIFVACLPCSGLIFADATWSQKSEDWLSSHVRLFAFLGGVTELVAPDNLKSGVTHASFYDPVLNASYTALLKHYGAAGLPTRVRRPKDKAAAENGVLQACRWLLAPLRNRRFFSLAEFNQALAEQVAVLNDKPMSPPREGSRRALFEAVERGALRPLPAEPYVVGQWKIKCVVNVNYHVHLDRNFYSVPFTLVSKTVDAFMTPTMVQILHRGERVASHPRAHGQNTWLTLTAHMPPEHAAAANQTPDYIREEAVKIGVAAAEYVERLLTSRDHVQQGVRSCLRILRLARELSAPRVEIACERALSAGVCSGEYVEHLLKSSRPIPEAAAEEGVGLHANIRGPDYYH
jgi:transposase